MSEDKKWGGFFKSSDPDLNIPVTKNESGLASPYLNFNTQYITDDQDIYIFPEGASHQRGRFEKAFMQIGTSVMIGGALGGVSGVYQAVKEIKPTRVRDMTSGIARTQVLNFVGKQGASSAQTLGTIGLMYSIFGVALSLLRGSDDEINTIASGAATGLLFKSSAGLKPCLRGGAVGLTAAAVYCLCTSPRFKS